MPPAPCASGQPHRLWPHRDIYESAAWAFATHPLMTFWTGAVSLVAKFPTLPPPIVVNPNDVATVFVRIENGSAAHPFDLFQDAAVKDLVLRGCGQHPLVAVHGLAIRCALRRVTENNDPRERRQSGSPKGLCHSRSVRAGRRRRPAE